MARVRADNYEDKKMLILSAAAALFSKLGYDGAKMEQIAARCGVSKSMLYHYFKKKEDVLFEILQQHVSQQIGIVRTYKDSNRADDGVEFFRGFVEAYIEPSGNARAQHVVALYNMRYLTDEQKAKQVVLERELLQLVLDVLAQISPNTGIAESKIYPLLLLGMMNWVELWYHRSGKISPAELYDRVAQLFLRGYRHPYERVAPVKIRKAQA